MPHEQGALALSCAPVKAQAAARTAAHMAGR